MSFVNPTRNKRGPAAGVVVAVVFHIFLVWALMNGLGRKVLQIINAPVETRIVEEVKPPPPPPKVIELPPPKFVPPPPAFVPPPEVQVQAPPAAPAITTTTVEPPPAPVRRVEAPAPAAPAQPAQVSVSVACSNYGQVMGDAGFPREAQRAGLEEGTAVIQFTLGVNGEVKDVKAVQASHPSFARGAMRIVGEYKCAGQGREVTVRVPFNFKTN